MRDYSNEQKMVKLSKFLALVLRHRPEEFGIELDNEGFTDLDKLVNIAREKNSWDWLYKETIVDLVENSPKKRFEIKDGKIRAIYGHSLSFKISYPEVEPPKYLYHGTSRISAEKIKEDGLKPMGRQYVHLSLTEEQALDVGRRHDVNPVLVKILAEKAHLDGIKFWKASDTIYLSLEIPPEYIAIDEQWGRKKKKVEKKLM